VVIDGVGVTVGLAVIVGVVVDVTVGAGALAVKVGSGDVSVGVGVCVDVTVGVGVGDVAVNTIVPLSALSQLDKLTVIPSKLRGVAPGAQYIPPAAPMYPEIKRAGGPKK
jgi:hypothetical protein